MLREIQQVLRLVKLMGKQRHQRGVKTAGGLVVLLWTETKTAAQSLNCTVAAAGPWCTGIKMKAFQSVLTDLKASMFPCTWPCPEPDPEELSVFTDLYGSLRLLLSFQMKDKRLLGPEWKTHLETFLRTFSLANAGIKIHLKYKFIHQTLQPEFRVKIKSRVAQAGERPLSLDVTCNTQPPGYVKKGCWCQGGHPVLGDRLLLSIPLRAMDQGLYGELSLQPVTLLRPCVLQYPNLATQLTHIQGALEAFAGMLASTSKSQAMLLKHWIFFTRSLLSPVEIEKGVYVLVYSPSNVPVTGPSSFFQNLPAHLGCEKLSVHGLHCSSYKDLVLNGGTVYEVEQENQEEESSLPTMQQGLLLFLFLQHSDPFTSQLSDVMATEVLIEHHLEDILSNNRQAVTAALQTELNKTLKAQHRRKRDQEKLHSAAKVILASSMSIVSCSSNMDFRNACLNSMKVRDTHELSASLCESLWRVTSWKFTPRGRCYSAQMEEEAESDGPTRTEI